MRLRRQCWWGAAALGLSFGLGGVAWAQEGPNPEELFKRLDKNGDGVIKADEVGGDQTRFFERLKRVADKDGNGELTREEFLAGVRAENQPAGERGRGERAAGERPAGDRPAGERPAGDRPRFDPGQRFDQLDANKDGKLTLDEVPEEAKDRLKQVFERLGKDALTKEEFVNAVGQGRPGGEGGRLDPARAADFFNRLDANGDGKVTLDEAPEPAKRMIEGALRRLNKAEGEGITKEEFQRFAAEARPGEGRPGEGRPAEGRPGEARPAEGRNAEGRNPAARPAEGRPPEGRGEGRPGEGRPPLPKFFQSLDTNGDGRLSREELAKAADLLDQLDENKDGQLDPRELLGPPPAGRPGEGRPAEGRPGEGRPGEGRPAVNPGERRPEGNAPAGRPGRPEGRPEAGQFGEQLFNRLDANKDGKISKDEAQGPLRENFDRFDTDKDGSVTLEELRRGMAARLRDGEGRRPNPDRPNPEGRRTEEKKPE